MEQQTDEWFAVRLGKVTCSRLTDLMAKTKSGYSTSRDNYMAQLICERLTGKKDESYTNAAMQWGIDTEAAARSAYEAHSGNVVSEIAFIQHPTIKDFGGSPDGLIGGDGLIEIKCPITATHIDWWRGKKVPAKHKAQMQGLMMVSGRKWCEFVSFDPRLPQHLQLFIVREPFDEKYCEAMSLEIQSFLIDLSAIELELTQATPTEKAT